jgi:hypothetical protein
LNGVGKDKLADHLLYEKSQDSFEPEGNIIYSRCTTAADSTLTLTRAQAAQLTTAVLTLHYSYGLNNIGQIIDLIHATGKE